jgi:chromosome segregation ATPase
MLLAITENVTVALITGLVALVTGTVASVFGYLAQKSAKETKREMTNGHPSNIRVDLDQKFSGVHERLDSVCSRLDSGDQSFKDLETKLEGICSRLKAHSGRFTDLTKRQEQLRTELADERRSADLVHHDLGERLHGVETRL